MNQISIADIEPQHYADILQINSDNVEMLSFLDEKGLEELLCAAALKKAALLDGRPVAFLIALREGKNYQSVNYAWFCSRIPRFLYIDRIAVSQAYRGMAIATCLYDEAFALARGSSVDTLTAEINVWPENRPSLAFHEKMGFEEVGRQTIDGGKKTVSMQMCRLGEAGGAAQGKK